MYNKMRRVTETQSHLSWLIGSDIKKAMIKPMISPKEPVKMSAIGTSLNLSSTHFKNAWECFMILGDMKKRMIAKINPKRVYNITS